MNWQAERQIELPSTGALDKFLPLGGQIYPHRASGHALAHRLGHLRQGQLAAAQQYLQRLPSPRTLDRRRREAQRLLATGELRAALVFEFRVLLHQLLQEVEGLGVSGVKPSCYGKKHLAAWPPLLVRYSPLEAKVMVDNCFQRLVARIERLTAAVIRPCGIRRERKGVL